MADKKQAKQAKPAKEGEKAERHFHLIQEGEPKGLFCGKTPKQAANKAFTSIIKAGDDKLLNKEISFTIKECTRGTKHREYHYVGIRQKLDAPIEVQYGGGDKKIKFNFHNKIKKVKPEAKDAPKKGGAKKAPAKKAPAKKAPAKKAPAKKAPAKKVKA